jgi:hypothetical protein
MRRTLTIGGLVISLLVLGIGQTAEASSNSADNQKTEDRKGVTVDDLVQGLKSAAHQIEQEIPKIGAAIGNAVKKITEKEPEKPPSQEPSKQKN